MTIDISKEDLIISDFLRSIGPWREYVVIGGGYSLIIYKLYLANQIEGNPPVGTRDLDSLIPRKIPEASKKDISKHLIEAGFKQFFKDQNDPATEAYVKEINGSEVEVEFLTDDETRGNKVDNIEIKGVIAQSLKYLKQSLKNPIDFKTRAGEEGKVVSPQAWIFHKGLTFPLRKDKGKKFKDLYGIWYAASQLQEFSTAAITQLKVLAQKSPWFKIFKENLRTWVQDANPADWNKLEAQDPFGALKKPNFILLVEKLISHI